jgi:hypothetical protein
MLQRLCHHARFVLMWPCFRTPRAAVAISRASSLLGSAHGANRLKMLAIAHETTMRTRSCTAPARPLQELTSWSRNGHAKSTDRSDLTSTAAAHRPHVRTGWGISGTAGNSSSARVRCLLIQVQRTSYPRARLDSMSRHVLAWYPVSTLGN